MATLVFGIPVMPNSPNNALSYGMSNAELIREIRSGPSFVGYRIQILREAGDDAMVVIHVVVASPPSAGMRERTVLEPGPCRGGYTGSTAARGR